MVPKGGPRVAQGCPRVAQGLLNGSYFPWHMNFIDPSISPELPKRTKNIEVRRCRAKRSQYDYLGRI